MENIPRDAEGYRQWWQDQRPDIPYGYCWCGCGERTPIAPWSHVQYGWVKRQPKRFVGQHRRALIPAEEYREYWFANTTVPYGYCWCGCGKETPITLETNRSKRQVRGEPRMHAAEHFDGKAKRARPQGECKAPGCTQLQRQRAWSKRGEPLYSTLCVSCEARKYAKPKKRSTAKPAFLGYHRKRRKKGPSLRTGPVTKQAAKDRLGHLRDRPCTRCGWSEGRCQLHRIIPGSRGGGYTRENVVPLCPNCHSLVTFGQIDEYTA